MRVAAVMILVMMFAGTQVGFLSAPAQARPDPVPVVTLRLDPPIQHARVTESAPAIVQFTGCMQTDKLPVERCVVTLTSTTDIGWVSQVSPTTAVFTSTTPQSFTCNVRVPQGTPQNVTGNLLIAAHMVAGGQLCTAEARGVVWVEPYFRVDVRSNMPFIEMPAGGQATLTYWTCNEGNSVDSFQGEITNLKDLSGRRWAVVQESNTIDKVGSGGSKPTKLTVESPGDRPFTDDYWTDIVVKVTSRNAKDFQQVVSQNLTLTIHIRTAWLPQLSPYVVIIALSVVVACLAARVVRERKKGAVARLE